MCVQLSFIYVYMYFFFFNQNFNVLLLACTFSCDRLSWAATNHAPSCARSAVPIKENKFLHVTIAAAWILVRATIRFRGVLRLDRRGDDRRCPSDDQGRGFARAASSHREVPLARRESRCFLLHFRHLFHREPIVPNHFASNLAEELLRRQDFNRSWQKFAQFGRKRF